MYEFYSSCFLLYERVVSNLVLGTSKEWPFLPVISFSSSQGSLVEKTVVKELRDLKLS